MCVRDLLEKKSHRPCIVDLNAVFSIIITLLQQAFHEKVNQTNKMNQFLGNLFVFLF